MNPTKSRCTRNVLATTSSGRTADLVCGDWFAGKRWYCDQCEARLRETYPQGWRFTPGDTCEHGAYVGGCGPDILCFYCEQGISAAELRAAREREEAIDCDPVRYYARLRGRGDNPRWAALQTVIRFERLGDALTARAQRILEL